MDPIQRANVPQAIADRILDLIARGEIRPGSQLPAQRELAKQLGVGVSSLRESLHSLTAMGIVQMQAGRGTYVNETFDGAAGRYAAVAPLASSQELTQLLEARLHLDSAVAEMACERATDEDLAAIRRAFELMVAAASAGDMPKLERADLDFHLSIAQAAHNEVMVHLIRSILSMISVQIHATPFSQQVISDHLEILESLEARDPVRAKAAAERVINSSLEQLRLRSATE